METRSLNIDVEKLEAIRERCAQLSDSVRRTHGAYLKSHYSAKELRESAEGMCDVMRMSRTRGWEEAAALLQRTRDGEPLPTDNKLLQGNEELRQRLEEMVESRKHRAERTAIWEELSERYKQTLAVTQRLQSYARDRGWVPPEERMDAAKARARGVGF